MISPRLGSVGPFLLFLFCSILCSTGCSQSHTTPDYPHSTPKELLNSIFTCVQQDDEAGFLTLLPTQEEAMTILNSHMNCELMTSMRDSVENHWDSMLTDYQVWGQNKFTQLKAELDGKIDLKAVTLDKIHTDYQFSEGLERGYAEATFGPNQTGVIGFSAAIRAGEGDYVLLETWDFSLSAGYMPD